MSNDARQSPRSVSLLTEVVPCTFCGSHHAKRLFTERYELAGSAVDLGINRCRGCELVYVSPRLTPESTRLVYELDTWQTISHAYCWDGSSSERRFDALLGRLAATARPGDRVPRGTLLDVGCGSGQFLRAAKRTGRWRVVGLEPIAAAAHEAERYAECEVRRAKLDDAGFPPGSFNVITLLGVLEHLHDPVGTLRSARRLLERGGVLAVYVPNFNYLRLKDTGPISYARTGRWSKLHPQEHLHQFTPRTLLLVLKACGFEVLRVDVGRPFVPRQWATRVLKEAAYAAACMLQISTGIHLGGLEVITRVDPKIAEPVGLQKSA
jgi:2-polyprenyl-3-methyl-5-hydroxy-6-metoxy-1,4-benzoquinol methylase